MRPWCVWLSLGLAAAACDESNGRNLVAGGADLGVALDLAGTNPSSGDGGATMSCLADAPDQTNCGCNPTGLVRACYPAAADPATRGVGPCHDGTQTCEARGEFAGFGDCSGAIIPTVEVCNDHLDNNCDGTIDCADPTCATDAACKTACTDGMTRACYTGPSGTLNVGTCRGGTQTCAGGQWPTTCPGQILPAAENCSDPRDHDCNHLPGCLDLFACVLSPACMGNCDAMKVDTGCVCPMGTADTATCPEGMHGVTKGGTLTMPGMDECCPCGAGDCGDPGCCGEPACAGNSQCNGLTCKPLPASCNGMVNADCDDFPEDCDEPCCKCTNCP